VVHKHEETHRRIPTGLSASFYVIVSVFNSDSGDVGVASTAYQWRKTDSRWKTKAQ